MLELVIRKCLLATKVDEVVVVTPDKELMKICRMCGVRCYVKTFEGRDVLREYYEAAYAENADLIVRVTADCPLLLPGEIDRCIEVFINSGKVHLAYNTDESTKQLNGEGSDCEVFWYDALVTAHRKATGDEREHVTTYMRRTMQTLFVPGAPLGITSINTREGYQWLCERLKKGA